MKRKIILGDKVIAPPKPEPESTGIGINQRGTPRWTARRPHAESCPCDDCRWQAQMSPSQRVCQCGHTAADHGSLNPPMGLCAACTCSAFVSRMTPAELDDDSPSPDSTHELDDDNSPAVAMPIAVAMPPPIVESEHADDSYLTYRNFTDVCSCGHMRGQHRDANGPGCLFGCMVQVPVSVTTRHIGGELFARTTFEPCHCTRFVFWREAR